MNEQHPIDTLFREGLSQAEVVPPAAVWDGIRNQQSWSSRLLTGVRKYWWVPLLFLTVSGVGIGVARSGQEQITTAALGTGANYMGASAIATHTPINAQAANANGVGERHDQVVAHTGSSAVSSTNKMIDPSAHSTQGGGVLSTEQAQQVGQAAPQGGALPHIVPSASEPRVSEKAAVIGQVIDGGSPRTHSDKSAPSATIQPPTTGGTPVSVVPNRDAHKIALRGGGSFSSVVASVGSAQESSFTAASDALVFFMDSRKVGLNRAGGTSGPRGGGKLNGSAGAIPPGDWWLGFGIGYHQADFTYAGRSGFLQEALNAGEAGSHSITIDGLVGRSWRNGFFVSAGLGTEALTTRASYSAMHQLPVYMDSLTFDTSGNPTITQFLAGYTDSLAQAAGPNRYSFVRLPIGAGWQKEFGRYEVGVHGGVVLELGTSRKGASLLAGTELNDSSLVSTVSLVDLGDVELNPRYGVGVSGYAGLHLGYRLTESTLIWASPEVNTRLTTISSAPMNPAINRYGLRVGMRFNLRY